MPQTSPMTWAMLSMSVPLLITSSFSFLSFNKQNNNPNHSNKKILMKNFNWTW